MYFKSLDDNSLSYWATLASNIRIRNLIRCPELFQRAICHSMPFNLSTMVLSTRFIFGEHLPICKIFKGYIYLDFWVIFAKGSEPFWQALQLAVRVMNISQYREPCHSMPFNFNTTVCTHFILSEPVHIFCILWINKMSSLDNNSLCYWVNLASTILLFWNLATDGNHSRVYSDMLCLLTWVLHIIVWLHNQWTRTAIYYTWE